MSKSSFSRLLIAGLLLGAGVAHAAAPVSVSEVPDAWYANEIRTPEPAHGAPAPVFPTAAYEHGPYGTHYADETRGRTQPSIAGAALPFPSSPNESGSVL